MKLYKRLNETISKCAVKMNTLGTLRTLFISIKDFCLYFSMNKHRQKGHMGPSVQLFNTVTLENKGHQKGFMVL